VPTARELLEQADALMRRNRERELEPDIPELTDEVDVPAGAELASPVGEPARAAPGNLGHAADAEHEEIPLEPHPDESEVSRWLATDLGAPSVTGPAPDSVVVVPQPAPPPPASAPAGRGEFHQVVRPAQAPALPTVASELVAARVAEGLTGPPAEPPPEVDEGFEAMLGNAPPGAPPGAEPAPFAMPTQAVAAPDAQALRFEEAPAPAGGIPASPEPPAPELAAASAENAFVDRAQLDALAEEIRMQVLQRIDIFTDTGLAGELGERLKPAVDRASADLIATINREVGQLLRAYVAEAIEREIEKWRQANP
jgi:hypothetical protein